MFCLSLSLSLSVSVLLCVCLSLLLCVCVCVPFSLSLSLSLALLSLWRALALSLLGTCSVKRIDHTLRYIFVVVVRCCCVCVCCHYVLLLLLVVCMLWLCSAKRNVAIVRATIQFLSLHVQLLLSMLLLLLSHAHAVVCCLMSLPFSWLWDLLCVAAYLYVRRLLPCSWLARWWNRMFLNVCTCPLRWLAAVCVCVCVQISGWCDAWV